MADSSDRVAHESIRGSQDSLQSQVVPQAACGPIASLEERFEVRALQIGNASFVELQVWVAAEQFAGAFGRPNQRSNGVATGKEVAYQQPSGRTGRSKDEVFHGWASMEGA